MKLIVKELQGGQCTIEVQPTTFISEVKQIIAIQLKIPVNQQKLLLLGRPLVDTNRVNSYPTIKEGSKINVLVTKPEGLEELAFRLFKKSGMSDLEAKNAVTNLLTDIQDNIYKLSWDDIERFSLSCLGQRAIATHNHGA